MRANYRFTFVLLILTFVANVSAQHTIIAIIDHGFGHITGLATGESQVWVVDSLTNTIYSYDHEGCFPTGTLPVLGTSSPVGLAWSDSVLYYAEAGAVVIHGLSTEGSYIGSWDLSSKGVQSIVGLGYDHDFWIGFDLLVGDLDNHLVWGLTFDADSVLLDSCIVLPDTLVFSDIAGGGGFVGDESSWLCCESPDPNETLQQWYDGGYFSNAGISFPSTCGVAQHELYNFDCIWVYVPEDGKIYLDWYGMGVEEETAVGDPLVPSMHLSPNPFSYSLNISYSPPEPAQMALSVYDLSGRVVEDLVSSPIAGGEYTETWNPSPSIPDGCYLIVLDAGGERVVRRAVLLR